MIYDDILEKESLRRFLDEHEEHANTRQYQTLKRALRRAIQTKLTEKQRDILMLYYFDHKTMPEIAEMLGINKSTVCRHIMRANKRLRGALECLIA